MGWPRWALGSLAGISGALGHSRILGAQHHCGAGSNPAEPLRFRGLCSGLQVGLVQGTRMKPLFVPWLPVPDTSRVLGAAPGRWQEEFQAPQCSLCSTCSGCCQDALFKEVLIHQIWRTASGISSGDVLVGKYLEALMLIWYFQAFCLKNAVKIRDSSRKTCPVFLPVQLGLTACALSIWKSSGELHLFFFLSQVKRGAVLSGLFCGGCQFCT